MTTITMKAATPTEWDDVQRALTGGGDGASCQCVWPLLRNKDWNATTKEQRVEILRDEITNGPPPGIVAYVDGEAAGWIRIGPRPAQARLAYTRAIAAATQEPFEDGSVWAVTCFSVRRDHRGKGLNAALLATAVEYARDAGARLVEGYPVDTAAVKVSSNDLFHGALSTFVGAGFSVVGELRSGRPLVALDLAS
ncbi:GNAT family N-acetyltransferase [Microbacterium azadirachtae]|uniref:GNAT family N-acetyltransferase n=1 Tax=Microbacterium azadirachtae TaxID=582680 RepID=UPI000892584A|nr:GNAT family N-acetyltransferase [Microbacterium azadirachtae]SDL12757.1 Acetyltransferase (GNAT) domain-containing protein [Microbacterium azadirachtae]SEF42680.1 Acetyltransferase (GNAT) domain-containing protein [Microbacterium azadirachtae]SEF42745.1 Acetyltransferase (GNAT) domain-containing protein [Microbacterium azadirachtae]